MVGNERSSDPNPPGPASTHNIQLGLIQTRIFQGQPGGYAGENDKDWHETSEDGLRELITFNVRATDMACVDDGGGRERWR